MEEKKKFLSPKKTIIKKGILLHKIASSEVGNFNLLRYLNKKKFKVFLSTGMSDLDDVKKACRKLNNCKLVLMQCTSLYPTNEEDSVTSYFRPL